MRATFKGYSFIQQLFSKRGYCAPALGTTVVNKKQSLPSWTSHSSMTAGNKYIPDANVARGKKRKKQGKGQRVTMRTTVRLAVREGLPATGTFEWSSV